MPRGYRGVIVALVGLTLSGPAPCQETEANKRHSQQSSDAQLDRIEATLKELPVTPAPDGGCPDGQEERQSDLCAQWKAADAAAESARWAWWTLIAGFVGLALGAGTLVAAWRAAHWAKEAASHTATGAREAEKAANASLAALDAAGEANEIARNAQRPYLVVRPSKDKLMDELGKWWGNMQYTKSGSGFATDLIISNVGPLPAFNVVMEINAEWAGFGQREEAFVEPGLASDIPITKSIYCLGPTVPDYKAGHGTVTSNLLTVGGTVHYEAPNGRKYFTKFKWLSSGLAEHPDRRGWHASPNPEDNERT